MRPIPASLTWKSPEFLVRLFLGYLLVPLVPPVLVLVTLYGTHGMSYREWFSYGDSSRILPFCGIYGLAAMLILGTPLLVLYLCLGWTNFISFLAGGGICAGIPAYVLFRGHVPLFLACFFVTAGIISGAVFRLILFGAETFPPTSNQGTSE